MSVQAPEAAALDESVKQNFEENSPARQLKQYCDTTGIAVTFEWEDSGSRGPTAFLCRAIVGEQVFTGTGTSKKASKHNAAAAVLTDLEYDGLAPLPNTHVFVPDDSNPISLLNTLASQHKMGMPKYLVVEERIWDKGQIHTMSCEVGKLMESGSGACKKIAKQEAASKVLEKLRRNLKLVPEPNTAPGKKAGRSRGRVTPYPGTTRPFSDYRRGASVQTFNTTLEKSLQNPIPRLFPNKRPIGPLMDFRQHHSGQEIQGHSAQYPWTQGSLNTGTIPPLLGHGQYLSAQQFKSTPTDYVQYPLAKGFLYTRMISPIQTHQQDTGALEFGQAPVGSEQFRLTNDSWIQHDTGKECTFSMGIGLPKYRNSWPFHELQQDPSVHNVTPTPGKTHSLQGHWP